MTELAKLPAATLTAASRPPRSARREVDHRHASDAGPTRPCATAGRSRCVGHIVRASARRAFRADLPGADHRRFVRGQGRARRAGGDRSPRHAAAGPDHAGAGGPTTVPVPRIVVVERRRDQPGSRWNWSRASRWSPCWTIRRSSPAWPRPGCGAPPRYCRDCTTYRSGHRARCRGAAHPGRRARALGTHHAAPSPPTWSPAATDSSTARAGNTRAGSDRPWYTATTASATSSPMVSNRPRSSTGRSGAPATPASNSAGSWSSPTAPTSRASAGKCRGCPPRRNSWTATSAAVRRWPTWPGSTPWAASRWPRSWATTCAGTARVATTTPTRRGCPPPSTASSRPRPRLLAG